MNDAGNTLNRAVVAGSNVVDGIGAATTLAVNAWNMLGRVLDTSISVVNDIKNKVGKTTELGKDSGQAGVDSINTSMRTLFGVNPELVKQVDAWNAAGDAYVPYNPIDGLQYIRYKFKLEMMNSNSVFAQYLDILKNAEGLYDDAALDEAGSGMENLQNSIVDACDAFFKMETAYKTDIKTYDSNGGVAAGCKMAPSITNQPYGAVAGASLNQDDQPSEDEQPPQTQPTGRRSRTAPNGGGVANNQQSQ
jgi:hypothetical protein